MDLNKTYYLFKWFVRFKNIFKEFKNLSVEKRRFRLRWDSNPANVGSDKNFKLN